MPFYAKDWRSPGEVWIKTQDGWEKQKILECRQGQAIDRNVIRSSDSDKENCNVDSNQDVRKWQGCIPPYCQITLKCTKEVAGFNGLSDALRRLDFRSAVHDHRRFPYTAKLLELLLSQQRITTLSGCAQKSVLNVLEEIAVQAQVTQQNGHVLSKLLCDLRRTIRGDSWWGQPLGSSQLWGKHVQTIDRIDAIATSIRQTETNLDENKPKFEDLPEECVREILFRLADHNDLWNAAEAYGMAQKLSAEQRLWKRLCRFHFSQLQINLILNEIKKEREKNTNNMLNKSNRNGRSLHPYLSNRNNTLRRSPARTDSEPLEQQPETNEQTTWPLIDNTRREDNVIRGRVSNAFHEHVNRHRNSLLSQQQNSDDCSSAPSRFVSFQDVRNHFDQRLDEQVDNRPQQRRHSVAKNKNDEAGDTRCDETDWEDVYHRLRRLFGLREDYVEVLHLCRTCRSLFWKTYGHPCVVNNQHDLNGYTDPESLYVPIPPQAFLKFFSL